MRFMGQADYPPRVLGERPRLEGIDALRGLVMVLMTIDHASGAFNAGRLMSDSARSYTPGTALDPKQFATRWITHLCAPTFVFLAGLSLSLSAERRRTRGESAASQDRFLVTRGLFIAACDPLWMTWGFGVQGKIVLQVLYAIGASFVAMAALRRLPPRWLGALALAVVFGHEALVGLVIRLSGGSRGPLAILLLTGGPLDPLVVAYPLVPWLAVMALGHAAGALVAGQPADRLAARSVGAGALALLVFAVVRGIDCYGNLGLHRDDASLLQWLHVSKYPPSLSYTALELGLMAILLAAFLRAPAGSRALWPLVLLGQTAFFFYLLHAHLLHAAAWALGLSRGAGLRATYVAAAATIAVLLPLCAAYRRYKSAHPDGWARYV
jgi:uncharacterized membrane protein